MSSIFGRTDSVFCLKGSTGKGAPRVWGCGEGRGDCPGPGTSLEIPQFASLAVSTGVRPQRLPRGPGHQTDAGNWSSQEPHLLLTWAGTVPIDLPTLLPERPPDMAVGVPGASTTGLDSPSPMWEGVSGLARSEMRPCPWLLLWRPDLARVEAPRCWELSQGTRLVAVASPVCQCWEII